MRILLIIIAMFVIGPPASYAGGYFVSPLKHDANPVFSGVEPSALRVGDEYWIYYDDGSDIYRRTSRDGVNFGEASLALPSGKYTSVSHDTDVYRMVYVAHGQQEIYLATSEDGLSFVNQGALVNAGDGWDDHYLADPSEIEIDGQYHLFYGASDGQYFSIGLATSSSGLPGTYIKQGVILSKSGGMQSRGVFDADVFEYLPNRYMMFYTGFDGVRQRPTYATSLDLRHWQITNVILYEPSQQWEMDATYGPNEPSVILEDGIFRVWYRGDPGGAWPDNIGYLEIPQNPFNGEPIIRMYLPQVIR